MSVKTIKKDPNKPIILLEKRLSASVQLENPRITRRKAIKAAKELGLK